MWTNPRDWNNGDLPGGADFDTHIRDNFRESVAYKTTGPGLTLFSTGAHAFDMVKNAVWQTADIGAPSVSYIDTSLTWAMGANDVWLFDGILYTTQAAVTTGANFKLLLPTGATILFHSEYIATAVDAGAGVASIFDYSTAAVFTSASLQKAYTRVQGIVYGNNVNAGNVMLQFAQLSASGNLVVLKKGSYLKLERIG